MAVRACAGAKGRDTAWLLGARPRASDRRRSRERQVLVSPRASAAAARQHCRRRNRGAESDGPARDPVTGIQPGIAIGAIPGDERVWVPQAPDVWFRPLLLNTVSGGWCNLL